MPRVGTASLKSDNFWSVDGVLACSPCIAFRGGALRGRPAEPFRADHCGAERRAGAPRPPDLPALV